MSKYLFIKEKLRAQIFIIFKKTLDTLVYLENKKKKKVPNWKEKKRKQMFGRSEKADRKSEKYRNMGIAREQKQKNMSVHDYNRDLSQFPHSSTCRELHWYAYTA